MNKFLYKGFKAFFLVFIFNLILFIVFSRGKWLSSQENFRHQLFDNKSKNRLFLIGGSSVGNSFDCELLSDKLGLEVFNVSFSLAHDSKFLLNYIVDNVRENDLVLFAPEFDRYYGNSKKISLPQVVSIYNNLELFKFLDLKLKKEFVLNIPKTNILLLYRQLKMIFFPHKFTEPYLNHRGDNTERNYISSTWKPSKTNRYVRNNYKNPNIDFLDLIKETNLALLKKKAKLLISFPPHPFSEYDKRLADDLINFYDNSSLILVGNVDDYIFNDNFFLNHPYHTNTEGTLMRTNTFIKNYLLIKSNIR